MQRNLVLAILLSFTVLLGWDLFVMRPRRPAQAPAAGRPAGPAPASTGAAPAARPAAMSFTGTQRFVEYVVGRNRVSFNLHGAAVHQWWIKEEGDLWIPLVPQDVPETRPLAAFPEVEFRVRRGPAGEIVFEGARPDGLHVRKTLRLSPDNHTHGVSIVLENRGKAPLDAAYEMGWGPGLESGDADPKERDASQRVLAFDPPRLLKLKPNGAHEGAFPWWGVDSRYFLAAFLNDGNEKLSLSVRKTGKLPTAVRAAALSLAPGQAAEQSFRLYLGPKGYAQLSRLDLGLERAVDFGVFGGVGKAILKSLYFLHRATHNYGWSIILLTTAIQILVIPLTLKSFRHSLRMKALQPQMKKLQEMYKGDPKRLNVEMLNLYQKHGLKFMGMEGCFPILIQLPVFWALYTTLRNAYELRGAAWIGWIQDLSVHDPYYVLPVLMGAGMLAQQKMTMASMDPQQARIMYLMPIIFTFFFLKLPSGLVLYWFTNSLLTIAIQAVLLKKHPPVEAAS